METPLPGGNKFVMLAPEGGGSNIVISLPMPGETHQPTSSITFEADDVRATCEELVAKGVIFTQPPEETPWGGVQATFRDPDGNTFMLQAGGM